MTQQKVPARVRWAGRVRHQPDPGPPGKAPASKTTFQFGGVRRARRQTHRGWAHQNQPPKSNKVDGTNGHRRKGKGRLRGRAGTGLLLLAGLALRVQLGGLLLVLQPLRLLPLLALRLELRLSLLEQSQALRLL